MVYETISQELRLNHIDETGKNKKKKKNQSRWFNE